MLRHEAQGHLAFGNEGLLVQTAAGSSVGRLVTGLAQFHNLPLVNVVRSERGAAELRKRFPDIPVVSDSRRHRRGRDTAPRSGTSSGTVPGPAG
ncbi:hypothetical protein ACFV47_41840 [Streptomyces solisilvae]|uniref:hypothetical protein n=1 Tax=Streptomyces malaysiensis TaxID=92644 RepID=UPI0036B0D8BD